MDCEPIDLEFVPRDRNARRRVRGSIRPFTMKAKREMVGNGVPRAMGLAIARAVKEALNESLTLENVNDIH